MLTKLGGQFKAECDVCGRQETFEANSHADAWEKLKRAAWGVRRKAFPIIHVCHECPIEAKKEEA